MGGFSRSRRRGGAGGSTYEGVRDKGLRSWFRSCQFFRRCSDAFIHGICDACETLVRTPQDGSIFKEGDTGETLYVISSGTVEILLENAPVSRLEAGDFFGEMNLLGITPRRGSTVRPLTVVDLSVLRRARFLSLIRRHPEDAARIKREADRVFFGGSVSSRGGGGNLRSPSTMGRQKRGGVELDETWDIFKPPVEMESDNEVCLSEERKRQLRDLTSVILCKTGCDGLNGALRDVHGECGITPRMPPGQSSSGSAGGPRGENLARSLGNSSSRPGQGVAGGRVLTAPSGMIGGVGGGGGAVIEPLKIQGRLSQQLTPGRTGVRGPTQPENVRLAKTVRATSGFERAMMSFVRRPQLPTIQDSLALLPAGAQRSAKGARQAELMAAYAEACRALEDLDDELQGANEEQQAVS